MTSAPDHNMPDTTTLDALAREAHAQALDRVSARTQAQLAQRRNAALRGATPRPARGLWPVLAAGSAVAVAVVLGVRMMPDTADTTVAVTPSRTSPASGASPDGTTTTPSTAAATTSSSAATVDGAPGTLATNDTTAPIAVGDDTDASLDSLIDEAFGVDDRTGEDDALSFAVASLDSDLPAANLPAGFEAFEETPDLYLWLADDSASGGDMESL